MCTVRVTQKVSGRGEGGMSGTLSTNSTCGPRRIFARASVLITLTKKIFNRPQKLYRNYTEILIRLCFSVLTALARFLLQPLS